MTWDSQPTIVFSKLTREVHCQGPDGFLYSPQDYASTMQDEAHDRARDLLEREWPCL